MDKTLLLTAQRIIRQRKPKVKATKRWKSFTDELNIGREQNGFIHFTPAEIDYLQAECDRRVGSPILDIDLSITDRMSMSAQSYDEKLAKGGVFEVMLSVARNNLLPIPIKDNEPATTPEGVVVSLMPDKLDRDNIDALLIIENGAAFVHWSEIIPLLPEESRDALLIYRGHRTNLRALQLLLTKISHRTPIFAFFDFDAAGFDMCQSLAKLHPIQVLVPQCWHDIHKLSAAELKKINKPKAFIDQRDILNRLLKKHSPEQNTKEIIKYLDNHKLAITQEHMIQKKWSLVVAD